MWFHFVWTKDFSFVFDFLFMRLSLVFSFQMPHSNSYFGMSSAGL